MTQDPHRSQPTSKCSGYTSVSVLESVSSTSSTVSAVLERMSVVAVSLMVGMSMKVSTLADCCKC